MHASRAATRQITQMPPSAAPTTAGCPQQPPPDRSLAKVRVALAAIEACTSPRCSAPHLLCPAQPSRHVCSSSDGQLHHTAASSSSAGSGTGSDSADTAPRAALSLACPGCSTSNMKAGRRWGGSACQSPAEAAALVGAARRKGARAHAQPYRAPPPGTQAELFPMLHLHPVGCHHIRPVHGRSCGGVVRLR